MKKAYAAIVAQALTKHGGRLSQKESSVLHKYYGLSDEYRHTLAELGAVYGVSRERIRQIKASALEKIGL